MFPGSLGPPEILVIGLLAVLFFGKRLPEVGKSLGKGIIEFKKGLQGLGDDEPVHAGGSSSASSSSSTAGLRGPDPKLDPGHEYLVPKFEPPSQPPTRESAGTVARSDF